MIQDIRMSEDNKEEKPKLPSLLNHFSCLGKPDLKDEEDEQEEILEQKQGLSIEEKEEVPEPPNLIQTKNEINRLLAEVEKLAIRKVQKFLELVSDDKINLDQTINALKAIADIRLTHEWTEKLKSAIKAKSSRLTPNNSHPSLAKLQGMAQRLGKEVSGDGRDSASKIKGSLDNFELPQD
jgi:hypothetical protein